MNSVPIPSSDGEAGMGCAVSVGKCGNRRSLFVGQHIDAMSQTASAKSVIDAHDSYAGGA